MSQNFFDRFGSLVVKLFVSLSCGVIAAMATAAWLFSATDCSVEAARWVVTIVLYATFAILVKKLVFANVRVKPLFTRLGRLRGRRARIAANNAWYEEYKRRKAAESYAKANGPFCEEHFGEPVHKETEEEEV